MEQNLTKYFFDEMNFKPLIHVQNTISLCQPQCTACLRNFLATSHVILYVGVTDEKK